MERVRVVGVPVDRTDAEGAVERVARAVEGGDRCRVLVMNANKAWLARRDGHLLRVLEEAELLVPEWAMVWAARRLGGPRLAHVGGITLMRRLLVEAERRGWSVYLLGARPEVVDALAARLRRDRPALRVAGRHHGYLDGALDGAVRRELARRRPDIVFVGMGSPRQERWIADAWDDIGVPAAMGVGGSFDVLAGLKKDTPSWARGHGLEWLYRLAQDPRRYWRRYLVTNGWFTASVLAERLLGGHVRR